VKLHPLAEYITIFELTRSIIVKLHPLAEYITIFAFTRSVK